MQVVAGQSPPQGTYSAAGAKEGGARCPLHWGQAAHARKTPPQEGGWASAAGRCPGLGSRLRGARGRSSSVPAEA